jgi:hypothetical protein
LALALLKTGNSIAARIAMIAMTTSSSIRVKPRLNKLAGMRVTAERCRASLVRDKQNRQRQFPCEDATRLDMHSIYTDALRIQRI